MTESLISKADFQRRLANMSTTTLWELNQKDQRLPRPVKVGGRVAYVESEVGEYIKSLISDRELVGA